MSYKARTAQRRLTCSDPMERAWGRVCKRLQKRKDGCHIFTGALTKRGYGKTYLVRGKEIYIHVLSWVRINGPVPDGLQILHTCDNRACCNQEHLFSGTPGDNMTDMAVKGRTRSKLTERQVQEILNSPLPYRELAKRYGLKSHKSIANIKNGATFKHVT